MKCHNNYKTLKEGFSTCRSVAVLALGLQGSCPDSSLTCKYASLCKLLFAHGIKNPCFHYWRGC